LKAITYRINTSNTSLTFITIAISTALSPSKTMVCGAKLSFAKYRVTQKNGNF